MAHTDEHRDKNEASASCSDLQLGWALHKPRSQAVRFTDEIREVKHQTFLVPRTSTGSIFAA